MANTYMGIDIGGSVTKGDPNFIQTLKSLLQKMVWKRPLSGCDLLLAHYGDDVVDYGIIEMCNKFR